MASDVVELERIKRNTGVEVPPPGGIDETRRLQGLLSNYEKFPEELLRYLPYGLQDFGYFPPDVIDGLIKEAELQKYNEMVKRNDPDARFSDPEFERQDLSGDVYEKLGRVDEPRRIYNITQPETLKALSGLLGAKAYYTPSRDEIVFPTGSKGIQAHEYMHRGIEKSPLTGKNVENIFSRKFHPGLTHEQEHLYIYSKTTPEVLEGIRKRDYPQMEEEDFLRYVATIEREVDRYRKDQAKKRLEELVKIF